MFPKRLWGLIGGAGLVVGILGDSISILGPIDEFLNEYSTEDAIGLIYNLHDAISSSNQEALRFMASIYADGVDFYGRTSSVSEVVDEKKRIFHRWPNRDYTFVPIEEKSACTRYQCVVVGWTKFNVSNGNGLYNSGSDMYKYTLERVNGNYKIVSEVNAK
ncbi:hypothetical protein [Donghicola mangrovi]|uniref:DUF4440 domain-containing protein n=1 Tax=Donghicola mangrovi TaxID=2729614 RepID=A0A850QDE3_9RHOB|nr:hypothetical protein [Donghicola mangrovi]NVO24910.1 hypothetical protein [Donghicola mangrovi]